MIPLNKLIAIEKKPLPACIGGFQSSHDTEHHESCCCINSGVFIFSDHTQWKTKWSVSIFFSSLGFWVDLYRYRALGYGNGIGFRDDKKMEMN